MLEEEDEWEGKTEKVEREEEGKAGLEKTGVAKVVNVVAKLGMALDMLLCMDAMVMGSFCSSVLDLGLIFFLGVLREEKQQATQTNKMNLCCDEEIRNKNNENKNNNKIKKYPFLGRSLPSLPLRHSTHLQ